MSGITIETQSITQANVLDLRAFDGVKAVLRILVDGVPHEFVAESIIIKPWTWRREDRNGVAEGVAIGAGCEADKSAP